MAVYYKRTLTLQGTKDESLTKPLVSRTNLTTSVLSYEAATVVSGNAATSMATFDDIDLGSIITVKAMYIEWSGANFRLRVTDVDGTSVLRLNSGGATTEKIWLCEGIEATGIAIKNIDSTSPVPYFIVLFGSES